MQDQDTSRQQDGITTQKGARLRIPIAAAGGGVTAQAVAFLDPEALLNVDEEAATYVIQRPLERFSDSIKLLSALRERALELAGDCEILEIEAHFFVRPTTGDAVGARLEGGQD